MLSKRDLLTSYVGHTSLRLARMSVIRKKIQSVKGQAVPCCFIFSWKENNLSSDS